MVVLGKKKKNLIRRTIAFVLTLAIVVGLFAGIDICLLPGTEALAASGDNETGVNQDNTYLLSIATGSSAANDHVLFIAVDYINENGFKCSEYVFPTEDSLYESYITASKAGKNTNIEVAEEKVGIKFDKLDSFKKNTLSSHSTNEFLFKPYYKINSIDRIRVFSTGNLSWSLISMQLYKVNTLYGLKTAGYVSGDYYIDFSGYLLATYTGERVLTCTNDKTFFFGGNTAGSLKLECKNTLNYDGTPGEPYDRHSQPGYCFKIDLADIYGAGLEELTNNNDTAFENLKLDERLLLKVDYVDNYKHSRTVTLPVITDAYLWMLDNMTSGNSTGYSSDTDLKKMIVEGFAQQGDSLIFTGKLPDCEKITKCSLTYSNNVSGHSWKSVPNTSNSRKFNKDDSISVLGLQIYKYNNIDEIKTDIHRVSYNVTDNYGMTYEQKTNQIKTDIRFSSDPSYFVTADTYNGIIINADTETDVHILNWNDTDKGNRVLTRTRDYANNAYLVTITTAGSVNCSTTSDAVLKVFYQNMSDIEIHSQEYDISELCRSFYGYWPYSAGDASYLYGTTYGHTFSVIVPMTNVKNITGVTIGLKDAPEMDDWQISGITVSKIRSCSDRMIVRNTSNVKVAGGNTIWNITRNIDAVPMYSTGDRVIYLGTEIEQRSKTIKGINEEIISESENIDWDRIRYSMTLKDAENLLFARSRDSYTVTVNVDTSLDNGTDEDSGSKNDFYFQLVFENGNSAYVLANQQLNGDGFRPGSQSFKIKVNQEMGDVVGINIIPDNIINENYDPTDKLNIESIDVSKDSKSGLSSTWTFNNIGWIEMPYSDSGAKKTVTGEQGHTANQLAKNFLVSSKQYSINLQFLINVGPIRGDITDFKGSLKGTLYYVDTMGVDKSLEFDIVQAIYEYDGVEPKYVNIANPGDPEELVAISDPKIMLQPESTDRFYVTVKDLAELKSIEVTAMTPNTAQDFSIKSVGVQTINKASNVMYYDNEGKILRDNGAVDICSSTNEDIVYYMLPRATAQMREFFFSKNSISIDTTDNSWQASVDREPVSRNDTINVFVYMKDDESITPIGKSGYNMSCYIEYTNAYGQNQRMTVTEMNKSVEDNVFYLFEQGVTGLTTIKKLNLEATVTSGVVSAPVDHVIVQQIRSGVVVNTYYYSINADVSIPGGFYAFPTQNPENNNLQRVTLQLGRDKSGSIDGSYTESTITPETRDIAVAIKYTVKGAKAVDKQYYSKYVFLSDMGYDSIKPGMQVDIDLNERYVDEIVGVKLVATGYLPVNVEKAICRVYDKTNATAPTLKTLISYDEDHQLDAKGVELVNGIEGTGSAKSLVPLSIELKTMAAQAEYEAGTDRPISMTLKYETASNDLLVPSTVKEITIDDIHEYISTGSTNTGDTAEIKLLVEGLDRVRSITLSAPSGLNSNWSIESIKLSYYPGADEASSLRIYDRIVGQRMTASKPVTVNFAEILIETNAYTVHVDGTQKTIGNARNIVNGEESFLIESGDYVEFATIVSGSDMGYTATAAEIDNEGHTAARPECLVTANNISTFKPPENNGAENVNYVITIKSIEAENITTVIHVAVKGRIAEINSGTDRMNPYDIETQIDWGDDVEPTPIPKPEAVPVGGSGSILNAADQGTDEGNTEGGNETDQGSDMPEITPTDAPENSAE